MEPGSQTGTWFCHSPKHGSLLNQSSRVYPDGRGSPQPGSACSRQTRQRRRVQRSGASTSSEPSRAATRSTDSGDVPTSMFAARQDRRPRRRRPGARPSRRTRTGRRATPRLTSPTLVSGIRDEVRRPPHVGRSAHRTSSSTSSGARAATMLGGGEPTSVKRGRVTCLGELAQL